MAEIKMSNIGKSGWGKFELTGVPSSSKANTTFLRLDGTLKNEPLIQEIAEERGVPTEKIVAHLAKGKVIEF